MNISAYCPAPKKLFLIILLMSLTFSLVCRQSSKIANVKDGVLDLSNYSFTCDGPFKLKGSWEFYWNRLIMPHDFETVELHNKKEFVPVPAVWNNYKLDKTNITGSGYGTYRIRLKLPPNADSPALYIHEINTAHNLFVNGKLIKSSGKVAREKSRALPGIVPYIVDLSGNGDIIELVIHVSNYSHKYGGIRTNIWFGNREKLQLMRDKNLFSNIFLFSCLIIIALYHSGLFIFRNNDPSHSLFAISCVIQSFRSLLLGEIFIIQLFPSLSWENLIRLEYITFITVIPLFNLFISLVFPNEYFKPIRKIGFGISALFLLITLFTPIYISSQLLLVYQIFTILLCLYVFGVMIYATVRKREGALLTLICFGFISLTIISDILYYNDIIPIGDLSSIGLFVFFLSQAYFLSIRYSKAFRTAEHLSTNLQEEVYKKTASLEWQTQEALKAKKEVENMSRQKTNFFMNLTHETKTPVTLIKNFLSLYISEKGSNKDLEIVYRNACELERNMDNYMQIEKAFNLELNIHNHDRITNLTTLIKELTPLYPQEMLSLDLEEDIYIKANPGALRRIFDNILINAFKYNDENVKISISLNKIEEKIVLEISDNGIGISAEEQKNIFTPFYQLSNNKQNIQGVGLGLSLVKSIVASLDGTIELISSLNRGVKFIITLNLYQKEGDNQTEAAPSDSNIIPIRVPYQKKKVKDSDYEPLKENILLVEDKDETQELIKRGLEDKYNIYIADNGLKALDKLEKLQKNGCLPRLIISDVMMDEIDGFTFLDIIKENENYKHIPLIYLTAKSTTEDKIEGYSKGAVAYITKPFSLDILIAAVNSNLESREHLLDDFEESRYNEQGFQELCESYGLSEIKVTILKYWLLESQSQDVISKRMGKSRRMIEKHIKSIKELTGMGGKKELKELFKDYI